MSVSCGARARPAPFQLKPAALVLVILLSLTGVLVLRGPSVADPETAAVRLDAAAARRANVHVELRALARQSSVLLEARSQAPRSPNAPRGSAGALLAAAADAGAVAMADRLGQDPTTLVIANADGSQVRIPVPGLLGAAFAPDGSWLAAVDGIGRLWRFDVATGSGEMLADGPFVGRLLVEPSGSILALAVSSVEAPYIARLVRVDPGDGVATELTEDELVYDMQPIGDGSLAAVVHRPSGTVVRRFAGGRPVGEVELGPGAVNVSLSADGTLLAWEHDGEVLLRAADGSERSIGAGHNPRLARDGSLVLVDRDDAGPALLAADGTILDQLDHPAILLPCGECGS